MLKMRRDADLALEPSQDNLRSDVRFDRLNGHQPVVLQVASQVNGPHPALAKHVPQFIPAAQFIV